MQLGNQVEWAIHSVVTLSALGEGDRLSAGALAEMYEVPPKYLAKALQALANAKIVTTTPGPRGGYRLARDAKQITMLDIVDAVEGTGRVFKCGEIRRRGPCRGISKTHFSPMCQIAATMHKAEDAYRAVLKGITVADIRDQVGRDVPAAILVPVRAFVAERLSRASGT